MITLNTYGGLIRRLNKVCPKKLKHCIVGILFGHNEHDLMKNEFLPFLDSFNLDSQCYTHIFFAGYISEKEKDQYPDNKHVTRGPQNMEWYFSPTAFHNLREDFESRTTWKFSGGVQLLFFDAERISSDEVRLCIDKAIIIDLLKARDNKYIPHIEIFLNEIFSESEKLNGGNIKDIQNNAYISELKLLPEILLKNITPATILNEYKKLNYFTIKDISLN